MYNSVLAGEEDNAISAADRIGVGGLSQVDLRAKLG